MNKEQEARLCKINSYGEEIKRLGAHVKDVVTEALTDDNNLLHYSIRLDSITTSLKAVLNKVNHEIGFNLKECARINIRYWLSVTLAALVALVIGLLLGLQL